MLPRLTLRSWSPAPTPSMRVLQVYDIKINFFQSSEPELDIIGTEVLNKLLNQTTKHRE